MTIAGALVGAALNDLLPELLLVFFLLLLLSLTAYKTLHKAYSMYLVENQTALRQQDEEADLLVRKTTCRVPYGAAETLVSDASSEEVEDSYGRTL